jgi:hypothetical protein
VIFVLWRKRHLPRDGEPASRRIGEAAPAVADTPTPRHPDTSASVPKPRPPFQLLAILLLAVVAAAGGFYLWHRQQASTPTAPAATPVTLTPAQEKAVKDFFAITDALSTSLAADNVSDFNQAVAKLHPALTALAQVFDSAHPGIHWSSASKASVIYGGYRVAWPRPPASGSILLQSGDGLEHLGGRDLTAEGFHPDRVPTSSACHDVNA